MQKVAEKNQYREAFIMNTLHSVGKLSVADATKELGVSEATVRRLFASMESEGKVIRSLSSVLLQPGTDAYSFSRFEKINRREKTLIGEKASGMVRNGDNIYLDCGTTVLQMAIALSARLSIETSFSINIVTNSIANLQALESCRQCKVILLGGEYNSERRDFSGVITEMCLSMLRFNKCFLGCEGVSASNGFSSNRLSLSSLNRKVIERSDHVVVLADSGKFSQEGLISYSNLSSVNTLVTDFISQGSLAQQMVKAGIEVVQAR